MSDARRIVVLTARAELRSAVTRLAALAGAAADVVTGSDEVRAAWRAAPLVIVGSDLAAVAAAAGLPRRDDVVVVTTTEPDAVLWRSTVELGAARLHVLPADEGSLVELMSDAIETTDAAGSTIAVVGGCGGAGASTLATAVAITAARASPTLLIDGDRFGGGLDVLLGAEQRPGTRWPELAGARGRLATTALTDAALQVDGLAVLSWDREGSAEIDAAAAIAVMAAATRGFSWVVVDLPRCPDPASSVLAAAADLVVLVVPATVRATAAAATVAAQVASRCAELRLVVRDPGAGRLAAAEVAGALGFSVVATLQSESAVVSAAQRGEPPLRRSRGSLAQACRALLAVARSTAVAA
jgi:secretion/DNA translocation related CpaE-like protein